MLFKFAVLGALLTVLCAVVWALILEPIIRLFTGGRPLWRR